MVTIAALSEAPQHRRDKKFGSRSYKGRFLHRLNTRQKTIGEVLRKLDRVPTADKDSITYFASLYGAANQPVSLQS